MTTISSTVAELTIAHAGNGLAHQHGEGAMLVVVLAVAVMLFLALRRA